MKFMKVILVKDPSMISQARIPSSESAGRIEYLPPRREGDEQDERS
jgi:hypothetical protein